MAKKQKNKGVTLIELLIVVLILAAMTAIAVPRIAQSAYNAKMRTCETNIDILNSAIERYYVNNGFTLLTWMLSSSTRAFFQTANQDVL